jgi:hypothetical protein
MHLRAFLQSSVRNAALAAALFSLVVNPVAPLALHAESGKAARTSPVQHVIIIIGENRTFDHVFATYVPKQGESVSNLLSKGIVNADGTPGGDFVFGDQQGLFRFYGDINGDRHVDIADFALFSSSFNLSTGQTGFLAAFDFNNDGHIDILDFGQFSIRFFALLP